MDGRGTRAATFPSKVPKELMDEANSQHRGFAVKSCYSSYLGFIVILIIGNLGVAKRVSEQNQ